MRILRVARFAARFAALGFSVAPETLELMRSMVRAGEADALVSERVWRELERALATDNPERAFQTLRRLRRAGGAAAGTDARRRPARGSSTRCTARPPSPRAQGQPDTAARWAALLAALPRGRGRSAVRSAARADRASRPGRARRAHAPSDLQATSDTSARLPTDPERMLTLLELGDAWRRPERFGRWLEVWCARAAAEAQPLADVDQCAARLAAARRATAAVQLDAAELATRRGPEIAALLHERRLAALRAL